LKNGLRGLYKKLDKKQKIVIITGFTGVGKTALGVELAKKYNGEIISADSIQVYRGFDIGSAKVTENEKQGIPHHLIDIIDANQTYSAGDFREHASEAINDIYSRGKLPIIVGGTGLYINSLLFPFDSDCKRDEKYREELEKIVQEKGKEFLHKMLEDVDRESAEALHINQVDRVIRALEIYKLTGKKKSELSRGQESNFDYLLIVLNRDREEVYNSINQRVDKMINDGLIKEIESLLSNGIRKDDPAMKGIGYKEIIMFLDGELDKDESIELLKKRTRNYAKRQLTYFKKMQNAVFVEYNDKEKIYSLVDEFLKIGV